MPENDAFLAQAPSCPTGSGPYTIRAGDTLFVLAQRYGTTVAAITTANPGLNPNNLQVGQVICVPGIAGPPAPPCPNGTLYTIRPGDTFYLLASRFGVSLQALLAANPGIDPNRLVVGQRICLPGVAAPPIQRVSTPCCVTLSLAPGAPEEASGENPIGALLIRQIAMSTRSLTFSAAGLRDPGIMGNFNVYLGTLAVTGETPTSPTVLRTAVMGSLVGAAGQPVTWAGSTVITELPAVTDVAEIHLYNSATGIRGPAVLRGTLAGCGR